MVVVVVVVGVFCVYVHSLMERRERMSMRIVDAGGWRSGESEGGGG